MLNKVTLLGRTGKAPDIKQYGDGKEMAIFPLATNEIWKDARGAKQESTEWHEIVAFGPVVSVIKQYVGKGALLYLEGKLETRSWDHNEETRKKTVVQLKEMKMIGEKTASVAVGGGAEPSKAQARSSYNDDIAF